MRYTLLDPLRGLAALWVLMFHYGFSLTFQEQFPLLYSLAGKGHMGVAMFFVISGYCLTASARSAARRAEGVGGFLYRRVKRIYPPFWCSILVVAAIPFITEGISSLNTGVFTAPSPDNRNLGYLAYDPADWLRLVTLTQVFCSGGNNLSDKFTSINAVYWSLAIEVQFYVVVAIALLFAKRFYTILAIALAVSIPFAVSPSAYRDGIFLPYWPMFAYGIVLYFLLERGWRVESAFGKHAPLISGIAIFVLMASYCWLTFAGWEIDQRVFAPAFAVSLWFATPFDPSFAALTKHRWRTIRVMIGGLLILGAMSYSVYLIHGRLQFLVIQFVRQVLSESISRDIVVIAITVVACYPFYRFCEEPFFRPAVASKAKTPNSQSAHMETAPVAVGEPVNG